MSTWILLCSMFIFVGEGEKKHTFQNFGTISQFEKIRYKMFTTSLSDT